ncbi:SIS domain-containing protein [Lactobacillus sp. ESL0677]|uniref:SIS domain-containing protein n=1 Tax=Lactobacillus sp. ESL0677 TaxID=2983208 RepID=UPI0023F641AB|nr:SIS domain-containing protein [Lactobacillus sp. ESL0677]WEV37233.1 SIS domain-containing protein [Lactobacillus sp. ESL0677]
MNLIQQYISETPKQLDKIVKGSKELFANVAKRDINKIIITGSGTSYHSGLQMQSLMRKRSGIEVLAFYPFMLTPDFFVGDNTRTLLIGISQGGSSFSTFNAMKTAKKAGCIVGTMAGETGAYIDQIADEVMTVNIGEEKAGAKTKGYYCTKLNLLLLADYIGLENGNLTKDQFDEDISNLNQTLEQFPHAYDRAYKWVEEHKEKLAKTDNLRVVGPSMLYGDVLESSLKVLETCRMPVTGYDFDEFIHGIYNAMNERASVVILDNGTEPRCQKMIEVLGDWTNNLYLVDTSDANNGNHFGYDVDVPKDFETFIYPMLMQVMASIVPTVMGFDPNTPKDPNFHMKLGSKKFNH